ncbi:MAG: hypothetical protein V3V08_23435 [Nannocystaceae bacterium]
MTDAPMTPEEYKAAARALARVVRDADAFGTPITVRALILARKVLSQTPRGIVDQGIAESKQRRGVVE